jgi:hypothetical protein
MTNFDMSKAKLGPDGKLSPESVAAVLAFVGQVKTLKVTDLTGKRPTTKIVRLKDAKR